MKAATEEDNSYNQDHFLDTTPAVLECLTQNRQDTHQLSVILQILFLIFSYLFLNHLRLFQFFHSLRRSITELVDSLVCDLLPFMAPRGIQFTVGYMAVAHLLLAFKLVFYRNKIFFCTS